MEILIPGLILVALMVYVSTRIKKSAAKAFEAETIETEDFVLVKPAGFLNVIGGDPQYAFQAYTKDFGTGDAVNIRKATAHITVNEAANQPPLDLVTSERIEQVGGRSYRLTEGKRNAGGTKISVLRKSADKDGRSFLFEIAVLPETTEEFLRDIESMLQSFELK